MSKERVIWNLVSDILKYHGNDFEDIYIHEFENHYGKQYRKIYCGLSYCFKLSCLPYPYENEIANAEEGCAYSFTGPWSSFKETGVNKAIEILNNYFKTKHQLSSESPNQVLS